MRPQHDSNPLRHADELVRLSRAASEMKVAAEAANLDDDARHEINNLLALVMGNVSLIPTVNDPARRQRLLDAARRADQDVRGRLGPTNRLSLDA